MKKALLLSVLIVFAGLMVFTGQQNSTLASVSSQFTYAENKVEVYYFHRNRRCGPCRLIENRTIQTMETYYKNEMESGEVSFFIINVEEEENKEIAQKFRALSTALIINAKNGAEEKTINLTSFAYRHIRNEEAFLTGLKEHIDKELGVLH
ncbi:MAG: hypothetical protein EA393_01535 [Bacteroidetes bacterium]|nr:MAG: hypothetical protein EA393_01535 [Bacteroidota bacterium]